MITLAEFQPAADASHLEGQTAFSLTLHVTDVRRSVEFYRVLFDREPAKHFHEFAEYILSEPAVALGLLHVSKYPGKPVNSLGLRLSSTEELQAIRERLELAGLPLLRSSPERVTLNDPDNNHLDLYVGEPDRSPFDESAPVTLTVRNNRVTWEHKICTPVPAAIPHADNSVDEITLQATFNSEATPEAIARLIAEVKQVLKPGGRVMVTGLVGDRLPSSPLALPGLASRMKTLPLEHTPMIALEEAGFTDIYYELLGDIICFQAPGVDLRKIRLFGTKPINGPTGETLEVCYLGPLAEVETDEGLVFRRGEPKRAGGDVANRLRSGPARAQFMIEESA